MFLYLKMSSFCLYLWNLVFVNKKYVSSSSLMPLTESLSSLVSDARAATKGVALLHVTCRIPPVSMLSRYLWLASVWEWCVCTSFCTFLPCDLLNTLTLYIIVFHHVQEISSYYFLKYFLLHLYFSLYLFISFWYSNHWTTWYCLENLTELTHFNFFLLQINLFLWIYFPSHQSFLLSSPKCSWAYFMKNLYSSNM